ncbi:MAG TPA: UPF0182 family protein, partial [Candidatus Limnocylindrales bacterium]
MRDLFDDFMEELRKRESAARGQPPGREGGSDDDQPDDHAVDEDLTGDEADAEEPASDESEPEPRPIFDVPRGRGGPPRRRGPGGPNDGDDLGGRAARAGRRVGLIAVIVIVLALVVLFGFGINLWTDALWYASVGFDSVFWTRLTASFGLFAGTGILAAIVLLGNLWLARRLSPPPAEGGRGSLRSFVDRLNEAAAQAGEPRRGRPGSPFGDGRGGFGRPPAVVFETGELPDLSPLAGIALVALAVLVALGVGASVGSAWQTVLLWVNRVPFSPDAATVVTDPIFGKDVSFFLFELPFLRLVQGLFNGLVVAALVISLAQYLIAASRGGLVFSTQVRVHLGVLAGLFLLSVAFGYQLDKFELVYSTRGIATGVSFTDQNAQFFAYDVLTVIS